MDACKEYGNKTEDADWRWAVIVSDTGEVLDVGDQGIDPT